MKIKIDIDDNIGQQMKDISRHLNLKQKDIAEGIGIKSSLVSYYMNNQRSQRVDILRKFLEFCREKRNNN